MAAEQQVYTASQIWVVIFAICAAYVLQTAFHEEIYPHGTAHIMPSEIRPTYAKIDYTNDSLQVKHGRTKRIYERLPQSKDGKQQKGIMKGQETILVGKDVTLYAMTEEARLVKLSDYEEDSDGFNVTAKVTDIRNLGPGRPLGGKITPDGKTLYIADAFLGLTRIQNFEDPTSKLEIVASRVKDTQDGSMSKILYANDLTIGPKSGKIYFTDASNIDPDRVGTRTWDTMYAAKMDLLRGKRTGRLLEFDPVEGKVRILSKEFHFANGIGIDKDETFLVFAETFGSRVWKYHLTGDKSNTVDVLMDSKDVTGYPDGLDCAWTHSERCYFVLPSSTSPIQKLLDMLPEFMEIPFRNFLLGLPKWLAPPVQKYGGVVEVDPQTGDFSYIQDPTGQDISALAGVTFHENKLYLGSLSVKYIGVYQL